ncbi:MAG: MFS transporter [Nevskia sp.]|nr:MFS transporter [Nevskia sp.]
MRIGRGHFAVVAAGMCAFFNMYITQALLPELRQAFGAGVAAVSLTVTATTLGVALAAPFAGGLADRYGRRRVLLIALALLTLATFGAASAGGLGSLLLWRALQGFCIPGIFTSAVAYIAEEWEPAEAAGMASLYVAGTVLGSFCGRFISGLVTAEYGWRSAFLTMGALNLAFLPLIALLLPRSRRFTPSTSLLASLSGIGAHLRNGPLLATYGIGFSLLFAQVGTFTYVNFYLSAAPFHLSTHALSFIFFVFLFGMAVTPFSGRWALHWSPRQVGLAALATSALGLLLTLEPWLPAILLGLVLSSAGVFIVQSLATATVPRLALGARSAAVGLYLTCYYFGGSVGASLPASIWSAPGWLGGWHGCVALVLLVQAAAALLVRATWAGRVARGVGSAALRQASSISAN